MLSMVWLRLVIVIKSIGLKDCKNQKILFKEVEKHVIYLGYGSKFNILFVSWKLLFKNKPEDPPTML
jgi:hypothetical protein